MADWAPNGTRLVFDSWDHDQPGWSKPWIATIDTSSGRLLSVERLPLPEGVRGTLFASWCPTDDEKIAFVEENEEGRQALWTIRTNGTQAKRLVDFESSTYGGLDFTPDGNTIVYAALAEDRMQLYAIPVTGGAPEQLTHDSASLILPQVSPNGRWVAATRIVRANELRRMVLSPD
jgi:TolB protein